MSKRDYLIRYLLIIKKLRNSKCATFREINDYFHREFELIDGPKEISLRTFQRDLTEIRTIFNIAIKCNKLNQYYIEEDDYQDYNSRLLEAFDIINSFQISYQLKPYILLEKRCPLGTQHLNGILHAIQNRYVLDFIYRKFYTETSGVREVEPYALKEYKGRWYLVSKDFKDNLIKIFALDRISDLSISNKKFSYPAGFDPNEYFRNCFGVIVPKKSEPVEIELSFEPLQGKYIKSYPLHESQIILEDNAKELRISLVLNETEDLIMELLSFGSEMKVLKPQSLIDIISQTANEMAKMYPAK